MIVCRSPDVRLLRRQERLEALPFFVREIPRIHAGGVTARESSHLTSCPTPLTSFPTRTLPNRRCTPTVRPSARPVAPRVSGKFGGRAARVGVGGLQGVACARRVTSARPVQRERLIEHEGAQAHPHPG